ncbi:hypothetical protein ANACOL_04118 [Anaerotruncus colihominis DSM 17241]|uniref:Uncharacterized protein n=1 Tax=Anaerotruncus colihominis DSM 17241 TaxID=445972 RepID=B0PH97_9FIRM|nr:hypothetical protein ANACOL_04118 [Anaerotruncus colihominis DSM 17241]
MHITIAVESASKMEIIFSFFALLNFVGLFFIIIQLFIIKVKYLQ